MRHARGLNAFYRGFEAGARAPAPAVAADRLRAARAAGSRRRERSVKGLLFDCRMCGQCILSSTGMSCPMNCPKNLRNGPCGGVRANGHCEVRPEMKCVWRRGGRRQRAHSRRRASAYAQVQAAVDRRLQGKSSWLRVVRERAGDTP